ncbi:4-(cytidine 5'-diphospho)-2-C-methyl-D-erythritol kinase [Woodsholea maritima]|uniref:4-(cytidine 5'-diphospho)-2-C-methyl-D-erythritol kinase n=1 Tax=Woodsholea maritima TaxID=240237 RepID=UPI0003741AEB|nr:4-(cytidine 5'-diphospho)-2-C-methyl-D-erythritol kinase [Woodsholea maritima]
MLTEFAPAKVNLSLHVGPVRLDGYHPLDSLVVFASVGDQLLIEQGEGLSLTIEGEGADILREEPHNLVLKAAYALRAVADNPDLGARMTLHKRLPLQSGLGGGSADAAAALRGLAQYWGLDLSVKQLAEIGSVVGSDVPACVYNRPLVMRGRGEKISPLVAWPSLHGVLVNPRVNVPTGPVFAAYDSAPVAALSEGALPFAGDHASAILCLSKTRNDLQAPALAQAPIIETVLGELCGLDGADLVRMTGSGATCFALFANDDLAHAAAQTLKARHAGWWIEAVTFKSALL